LQILKPVSAILFGSQANKLCGEEVTTMTEETEHDMEEKFDTVA